MRDSVKSIDDLVDQIYEAAWTPERWSQFLVDLAHRLDSKSALLRVIDLGGSRRVLSSYHHNLDNSLQQHYINGYVAQDPFLDSLLEFPAGRMVRNDNLIDLDQLSHTGFYQHYMRPLDNHHIIGGFVERSEGDLHTIVGVHRHSGSERFSDPELRLVQSLVPHIRRAIRMGRRLGRERIRAATAEQALEELNIACFLLTRDGDLVHTNGSGELLLRDEAVLAMRAGKLVPACRPDQHPFTALMEQVGRRNPLCRSAVLRLRSRQGCQTHVVATVMPAPGTTAVYPGLRPDIAVYVTNLDDMGMLRPEVLMQLYGLTPAEARLAVGLAQGPSIRELSESWKVSPQTLRTQLKAVFAKTGVSRQSDLVRLLAGASRSFPGRES